MTPAIETAITPAAQPAVNGSDGIMPDPLPVGWRDEDFYQVWLERIEQAGVD